MTDINLEGMSLDELKAQAKVLDVPFSGNIGEETLRKKIREKLGLAEPDVDADQQENESVKAAAPTSKAEAKAAEEAQNKKNMERVKIIINESETDKQPVQVGLNGRNYVMQRGKEVEVPRAVLMVLDNACYTKYDPETMEPRKVKRFPYQLV